MSGVKEAFSEKMSQSNQLGLKKKRRTKNTGLFKAITQDWWAVKQVHPMTLAFPSITTASGVSQRDPLSHSQGADKWPCKILSISLEYKQKKRTMD